MIRRPYLQTIETVIAVHVQGQVVNTNAITRQVAARHPEVSADKIRERVIEEAIRRCEVFEWGQELRTSA